MEQQKAEKATRMNLYMAVSIREDIERYSEEMGMTKSAFITLCVNQFIDQKKAMQSMQNFSELLERFDNLERRLDSSKE